MLLSDRLEALLNAEPDRWFTAAELRRTLEESGNIYSIMSVVQGLSYLKSSGRASILVPQELNDRARYGAWRGEVFVDDSFLNVVDSD